MDSRLDTTTDNAFEPLSFTALTRRINAMPTYDAGRATSPRMAKIGSALALSSFALSIPISKLSINGQLQIAILLSLLVLEVVGLLLSFWHTRHEFLSMRAPLDDFANQLDHDYVHHFALIDWLTCQPKEELERYNAMTSFRRERFAQKLPLLFGNIPTLGIIPIVIALYLQAQQYAQGKSLDWIDAIAGFVLAMLYVWSWTFAAMKARLEGMDMYLRAALDIKLKAAECAEPVKMQVA